MKKYLVIGNPIEHSLSPLLHNFWIKINKINASYDKMKVEENGIRKLIQDIKLKKIDGLNITVPFKKKVIPYLDELSDEAKQTQSVNTIFLRENSVIGHNTDVGGFFMAIKSLNFSMAGKKIFILGAGGVVPSIIFALNKIKVSEIVVSNRTKQKADDLKNHFKNLKVIEWGKVPIFDVVINATSLGLNKEIINIDFSNIGKDKLFYDVIYNPRETNFLRKGKELGNKTENGKLMFIYQALESFKIWHNVKPVVNNETLKLLEND